MLAKSVIDGQNFRRVMETFMSDVQYEFLCGWNIAAYLHTPLRYRINGSNYSLRSIISEFGCAIFETHSILAYSLLTWNQVHRAEA